MAKIAGIESTAKSKSEDSTMIRTNKSFVPNNFDFPLYITRVKKRSPSKFVLMGIILRNNLTPRELL